jgi:hypothetical protein
MKLRPGFSPRLPAIFSGGGSRGKRRPLSDVLGSGPRAAESVKTSPPGVVEDWRKSFDLREICQAGYRRLRRGGEVKT